MKLSALSFIIAGAGLLQANANPLRVVWISQEATISTKSGSDEAVAHIHTPKVLTNGTHHGCAGARGGLFRQKAAELSNALRAALGMPLVETIHKPHGVHFDFEKDGEDGRVHHKHHHHHHEEEISDDELKTEEDGEGRVKEQGEEAPHHWHHHHHHKFHGKGHFHGKGRQACFFKRLHFALASLGPWEGRAIAFVIGCGLGVLLRMFWVLTVVAFRAIRGDRPESEYIPLPNQHDAEEIFVAPPVYMIDEKAPLKEEMNAVPNTN